MKLSLWRPEDLVEVGCDLCKCSASRKLITRADGMQVRECLTCGLAYLCPRPKPELVARFYEKQYFAKKNGEALGYSDYASDESRQLQLVAANRRLDLIKKLWQPAGNRCLEVGCATGEFCHALQKRGASVIGLDLSSFALRKAADAFPEITFQEGGIEKMKVEAPFDAVFAFEVIEHVLSPMQFLAHARSLLRPGGLLVLSTPNLECGRNVGLKRWSGFQMSFEHLYFFDLQALRRMGGATGFVVLAAFSGGGTAVIASATNTPTRHRLKLLLQKAGLLEFARRVKRPLNVRETGSYETTTRNHNLLVILRAQEANIDTSGIGPCGVSR